MSNRLWYGEPLRLPPQHLLPAADRPVWAMARSAWRRYRSRQRIAQLDWRVLKDIGASFAEAEAEANKPFWRR
jgi:uncharacterized protein YjiS (DUF1127 family)